MKRIIITQYASMPIGPYSQGVLSGGTLYTSGQIAINPETGELEIEDIKSETKLVMENLRAVLLEANMDFENIVKCSIFISNMNNFAQINEVYGTFFTDDFPARETVEVSCLPKNVNVEISAIAVK